MTDAGEARWEALVIVLEYGDLGLIGVFVVVSESEPSVKGRWMSDRCLITQ